MSLMGFLTGAASLFSGGGGTTTNQDSKESSTTTSNANSEQAATASETKTGTTNQSQNSTGTSNTTGSTAQTGTTAGVEASQTTGTTTNYSSDVLASLDSLLKSQLGGGTGVGTAQQATDAIAGRLTQIQDLANKPAFDVNGYVAGITQAATAATQNDLDSRINSILSATGSSEGGNSMSALLGAKLRNDATANLAGVTANAKLAGEEMASKQNESMTSQIGSLSGDLMSNISNLLAAAKGGTQQTTGAATATSNQQTAQQGSTAQQTAEQQAATTTQTENVKTDQSGLTQTKESGIATTSKEGSINQNTSKDLFSQIFDALKSSAAAA